ncbi:hypothetical protein FV228_02260 [Methylobacterium sp. WL18]|uniref:hypothetical protein n=1 Tax=Methylobacterium sp. WL18 TaxID=2603897 RepID=UPI0011CCC828|nr:hypothetical protein [Methylobacterium sp. WL18]TXN75921.1 hypothetical protein FV228_02260 [Methylobacterium sp. WL18]
MIVIIRILSQILFVVVAIYGSLAGIAAAVAPRGSEVETVDTGVAASTIYVTATKYLMFMQSALRSKDRRVIVLGASNADIELRPNILRQTIQCAAVDNLSIGNENVTELYQTALIAYRNRQHYGEPADVYVLGVWFGLFGDSKYRWNGAGREENQTDLDVEFLRYGNYKKDGEFYVSRLGSKYEHIANILVGPYILFEKISREATASLRKWFFVRPDSRTDEEREAFVISDADKAAAVAYWQQQIGSSEHLAPTQFEILVKIIEMLSRGKNKVIVVDLPVPSWWSVATPFYREYKDRLAAIEKKFSGATAVKFLSLSQYEKSEYFSDEVHAKPYVASLIGADVAKAINADACHSTTNQQVLEGKRYDPE